MLTSYLHAFALFFSLLNPFLMSIYMIGMIRNSEAKVFNKALIQGCLIAFIVFMLFAWGGEAIFSKYLNVRFEAFQIFGGLIFLVIGYRYVFQGADTIGEMRGAPEHLAGNYCHAFYDWSRNHQCCCGDRYGTANQWRGHDYFPDFGVDLWLDDFNEICA